MRTITVGSKVRENIVGDGEPRGQRRRTNFPLPTSLSAYFKIGQKDQEQKKKDQLSPDLNPDK